MEQKNVATSCFKYINLDYLYSIAEDNSELIIEIIEIFEGQIPEFVSEMNDALKSNNWKALSAVAHKAKSSVSIVGLKDLSDELKQLEDNANDGARTEEYPEMINNFVLVCNHAVNELNEYKNSL